ncbi:MAG: hypothetical protein ABR543_18960 [Gemmatimonadaceae bacterium]
MSPSKDWDKEMAKIDARLKATSDEELLAASSAKPTPAQGGKSKMSAPAVVPATTSTVGVLSRVMLAVALGAGMYFWPYAARCGPGLFAYLGAVGVLGLAGVWTSVWTWRHRAGKAHVLSLLIVLWAVVLGALEVLPRLGYAIPTVSHPATWVCG